MDLRTQTSLLAAVLCFAISATVLLRARKRRVHWYFGLFGVTTGAWYLSSFLSRFFGGGEFWERLNLVCAVLLPLSAVQFFRTFLQPNALRTRQLQNGGLLLALGMIAMVFTPLYEQEVFAALIVSYVFVLLGVSLAMLWNASRAARSRFDRARLRYLVVAGALAMVFTLAEYLPYAGLEIPPVGTILILVFLFVVSQSILRYRLLDLYELAARLTLLTALSFSLAGMVFVLVLLDPGHFFLHSVVAALVLFLVADPVRNMLEQQINQIFFRERYDLEQAIVGLRTKLAHTLELHEMTEALPRRPRRLSPGDRRCALPRRRDGAGLRPVRPPRPGADRPRRARRGPAAPRPPAARRSAGPGEPRARARRRPRAPGGP